MIVLVRKVEWNKYKDACEKKGTYASADLREYMGKTVAEVNPV